MLQSLLLQPLDVNPPPPRLARQVIGVLPLFEPNRIGYNEFSPLFASDGLGLLADGFAGNFGTIGGTLLANGLYRNLSGSVGQFYSRTDGIHANGDLRSRITDIIFQPALSDQASLLGEFRYSNFDAGDFQSRFNLTNFNPVERQTANDREYRVGGHFKASPGVTLVGVWTRENVDFLQDFGPFSAAHQHVFTDAGEAAAYLTGDWFNIIAGGSVLSGSIGLSLTPFGPASPIPLQADDQSAWLYENLAPVTGLRLTLGGAFDRLRESVNQIKTFDFTVFNPKLGISWDVRPGTTLRAAWFETLKRPLVGDYSSRSGQTIEPTQIAGFNQFFNDRPAHRRGAGVSGSTRSLPIPFSPPTPYWSVQNGRRAS